MADNKVKKVFIEVLGMILIFTPWIALAIFKIFSNVIASVICGVFLAVFSYMGWRPYLANMLSKLEGTEKGKASNKNTKS